MPRASNWLLVLLVVMLTGRSIVPVGVLPVGEPQAPLSLASVQYDVDHAGERSSEHDCHRQADVVEAPAPPCCHHHGEGCMSDGCLAECVQLPSMLLSEVAYFSSEALPHPAAVAPLPASWAPHPPSRPPRV